MEQCDDGEWVKAEDYDDCVEKLKFWIDEYKEKRDDSDQAWKRYFACERRLLNRQIALYLSTVFNCVALIAWWIS